jgi:putative ABC transport system permease protein
MLQNTLQSFGLALQNIRANLFHTFLSVLGIVIGVAALVATFSLIDGLEQFAREQISAQTSINAIAVETQQTKMVNNLPVRKDTFQIIDYERFVRIKTAVPLASKSILSADFNREIRMVGRDSALGARIIAVGDTPPGADTIVLHGQMFAPTAFSGREQVALVNEQLARLIAGTGGDLGQVPGQSFGVMGRTLRILGVVKDKREGSPPTIFMPISLLNAAELHRSPPSLMLEAAKTEDVPTIKAQVEAWLKQEFGAENNDFQVHSQDHWVGETKKGFLIFRIIMGMIIGISVVVGGVGVMNVLLISVNERTAEIGLRKAVGAKKGDIRRLFLAESITVSAFGSFIGLLLGAGFAMVAIPIIRFFADVPFNAALTWNTFFIISAVAVLVGIIFGTYPAVKAARLDPVEALRRE